ncbi:MAG TPA: hypothetical protein VIJ57_06235 [Hanamia sp.]
MFKTQSRIQMESKNLLKEELNESHDIEGSIRIFRLLVQNKYQKAIEPAGSYQAEQ